MKKVLVVVPVFSQQCPEAVEYLHSRGIEVIQNSFGLPFHFEKYDDLMAEIDAVIAGVEVWSRERMEKCPNLKIIARFGIGIDNLDLASAKDLGIVLTNAPGFSTNAVAEHAMGLILDITRRITQFNTEVHAGEWVKHPSMSLEGKTLGMFGCGAIGGRVARLAQAFGMQVVAYDAYPNAELAARLGVELMDKKDMLAVADIVSVHVPGTAETVHLVDEEAFSHMKKGAYFVNAARGSVVDETALYKALASGHLRAAAADVFEEEPLPMDSPLRSLPNFIMTPHAAAITYDVNRAVADCCVRAVADCLEGRVPANIVNSWN